MAFLLVGEQRAVSPSESVPNETACGSWQELPLHQLLLLQSSTRLRRREG